jgi:hypothetical protein
MVRILYITAIFTVVLPMLSSCRAISSFLSNDEIVAQVGQEKLYKSDIDMVVPKGLAKEDSTRLAARYINSWASEHVYLKIAEEQLSKSEKDVSKELEDYRRSLLKYRYEQLYVNERLDTTVTAANIEEYYAANQNKFILDKPIVKARYLNIDKESPALKPIRKRMSSEDANDLVEADSLAFSSALKFTTWDNRWIDMSTLAKEYATDYSNLQSKMDKGWVEVVDTLGYMKLSYVSEIIQKGNVAPIEFCAERIKDLIISERKQAMISSLEQDLLNDALENRQFIIYR